MEAALAASARVRLSSGECRYKLSLLTRKFDFSSRITDGRRRQQLPYGNFLPSPSPTLVVENSPCRSSRFRADGILSLT